MENEGTVPGRSVIKTATRSISHCCAQVLFQDGRFQWKRLENLLSLAQQGAGGGKGLDMSDTVASGARVVLAGPAPAHASCSWRSPRTTACTLTCASTCRAAGRALSDDSEMVLEQQGCIQAAAQHTCTAVLRQAYNALHGL